MYNCDDSVRRLTVVLPKVRRWIEDCIEQHKDHIKAVHSLGFDRLGHYYPNELLETTNVVTVATVPFPPLDSWGLSELAPPRRKQLAGITFKKTIFLRRETTSESLCFHELVHVVQWAKLGADKFLLAYGLGLLQSGYEKSPLEQMAYALQHRFELDTLPEHIVQYIENKSDDIWKGLAEIHNS